MELTITDITLSILPSGENFAVVVMVEKDHGQPRQATSLRLAVTGPNPYNVGDKYLISVEKVVEPDA